MTEELTGARARRRPALVVAALGVSGRSVEKPIEPCARYGEVPRQDRVWESGCITRTDMAHCVVGVNGSNRITHSWRFAPPMTPKWISGKSRAPLAPDLDRAFLMDVGPQQLTRAPIRSYESFPHRSLMHEMLYRSPHCRSCRKSLGWLSCKARTEHFRQGWGQT